MSPPLPGPATRQLPGTAKQGPGEPYSWPGGPANRTSDPSAPSRRAQHAVTPIRKRPHASSGAVPAGQPARVLRQSRRRVLLSFCLDYLALQPTSNLNDGPVTVHAIAWWTRRTPLSARHRWSRARRITMYRIGRIFLDRPRARPNTERDIGNGVTVHGQAIDRAWGGGGGCWVLVGGCRRAALTATEGQDAARGLYVLPASLGGETPRSRSRWDC